MSGLNIDAEKGNPISVAVVSPVYRERTHALEETLSARCKQLCLISNSNVVDDGSPEAVEVVVNDSETGFYGSAESSSHTTVFRNDLAFLQRIEVYSRSLASVLSRFRERFPSESFLLKIDVEGADCALLFKTPADLFSSVNEIIFECHNFSQCSPQLILDRLNAIGYECVTCVTGFDLHHWGVRKNLLASALERPF